VSPDNQRPRLQLVLRCQCGMEHNPSVNYFPTVCVRQECRTEVVGVPSEHSDFVFEILKLADVALTNPECLPEALHEANVASRRAKSPFTIWIRELEA